LVENDVIIPEAAVAAMERGELSARAVCLLSVLSLVAMRNPHQVEPTPADAPIPRDRAVRVSVRELESLASLAFNTVRKCLSELSAVGIVEQIPAEHTRSKPTYRIRFDPHASGRRPWVPVPERAIDLVPENHIQPSSVALLAFLAARRDHASNTISMGIRSILHKTRMRYATFVLGREELRSAGVLRVIQTGGMSTGRPTYALVFPPARNAQLTQTGNGKGGAATVFNAQLTQTGNTPPMASDSNGNTHLTQTGNESDSIGHTRISTSTQYKNNLSSSARAQSSRERRLKPVNNPPSRSDLVKLLVNVGELSEPSIKGAWINAITELVEAFGWDAVEEALSVAADRSENHPLKRIGYARKILENR
jgi:hypothetical protein